MHPELRHFIQTFLRVVATTLFVVAGVAFLTLPYALGGHPGEARVAEAPFAKHMT